MYLDELVGRALDKVVTEWTEARNLAWCAKFAKEEGKVSPGFRPPIPDSLQEPKDTSQL